MTDSTSISPLVVRAVCFTSAAVALSAMSFVSSMAGEPVSPVDSAEPELLREYIVQGMLYQREQLRSGVYRAHGRKVDDDPRWPGIDGDVTIYCAFDLDEPRLRFDRVEPSLSATDFDARPDEVHDIVDGNTALPSTFATELVSLEWRYVRTADRSLVWCTDWPVVQVKRPDESPPSGVAPFDVRALGLAYWMDFVKGYQFEELVESYKAETPVEIVRIPEAVFRATWIRGGTRTVVWIDSEQGVSPIRLEVSERLPAATEDGSGNWSQPKLVSDVTWQAINGVWVPRTFSIEELHLAPRVMKYELTFDWESVNQDIPDEVFSEEGLELPERTVTVDDRLGEPVVTGLLAAPQAPGVEPGHTFQWWLLVILNLAAGGAVVGVIVHRLLTRRARGNA